MTDSASGPKTLAIDIGGTGLKMEVIDVLGGPLTDRSRVVTPRPATPKAVLAAIRGMLGAQGEFDRVSVGFPGVVLDGVTKTAPNLHPAWQGYNLAEALSKLTNRPTHVANDADVQGYGDISGYGVELVITLGTGVGSAVYIDGCLVPNLELGHQPFQKNQTYEDYLGKAALDKIGPKPWRKRVSKVIKQLEPIWNYRLLYLGGGNAKLLKADDMPDNVRIASNTAGLIGGVKLWDDGPPQALDS